MQNFKKHLTGLLLISIAVIGIVASSSSDTAHSTSDYLLPADFKPGKEILLIEKAGDEKQVKEMEEYMSQNYSYKYEFITWDDLSSDKYIDISAYRFVIRKVVVNKDHKKKFDYRFYDRLHNLSYEITDDEADSPKKPLEKIIKKVIRKNQ